MKKFRIYNVYFLQSKVCSPPPYCWAFCFWIHVRSYSNLLQWFCYDWKRIIIIYWLRNLNSKLNMFITNHFRINLHWNNIFTWNAFSNFRGTNIFTRWISKRTDRSLKKISLLTKRKDIWFTMFLNIMTSKLHDSLKTLKQ